MLTRTPHQMARELTKQRTKSGPMYFVLCDYGPAIGQAYDECDPASASFDDVIRRLAAGEYSDPLQVIEVDLAKGTSRDVTCEAWIMVRQQAYEAGEQPLDIFC